MIYKGDFATQWMRGPLEIPVPLSTKGGGCVPGSKVMVATAGQSRLMQSEN